MVLDRRSHRRGHESGAGIIQMNAVANPGVSARGRSSSSVMVGPSLTKKWTHSIVFDL